jgi:hypothetical protein
MFSTSAFFFFLFFGFTFSLYVATHAQRIVKKGAEKRKGEWGAALSRLVSTRVIAWFLRFFYAALSIVFACLIFYFAHMLAMSLIK